MKRAENVLKMFLRKGRKYRKEFRENFEMLVNAQIATEDQIKRTDQQIEALAVSQAKTEQALDRLAMSQAKTEQAVDRVATSQAKTEQALDRLATSQAKTDEALRRFINSLNKSRNGNSEN
jgi:hypothetical protein